eukprot:scaffold4943_cov127-Isochrysis_galbana.AAC.6
MCHSGAHGSPRHHRACGIWAVGVLAVGGRCGYCVWGRSVHLVPARGPGLKALHASGDSAGHPLSIAVRSLPPSLPIRSPPLLLIQAVCCGGMVSELRALQQPGLEY